MVALAGSSFAPTVKATLTSQTVAPDFSVFEIGTRYFFATASLAVFLACTVLQLCGPGARDDETGALLPATVEQRFVWVLSGLLIMFDDPLLAAQLYAPSVGESSRPRIESSVDLPQPEGPAMETYSPWLMSR